MSFKAVAWTLLAAMAFTTVLLFNYWAAYQPLSTLAYSGIVLALGGLANLVLPFRFLGVRKRAVGALILAGGEAKPEVRCAAIGRTNLLRRSPGRRDGRRRRRPRRRIVLWAALRQLDATA